MISMFRKMITTEKPRTIYEQLISHKGRQGYTWKIKNTPRLTITSSKLIERGAKLWNMLDEETKMIKGDITFKRECKRWTLKNIPIKPG